MNNVEIIIQGRSMSGKSALAAFIKLALGSRGIKTNITGCEDEKPGVMDKTAWARLETLKGRTVEINTVRTEVEVPA